SGYNSYKYLVKYQQYSTLEYNLSLIPKGYDLQIGKLKMEDQDYIFSSIDYVLSEIHRNKIWEMIWKRWCFFEQVRNQEK
ncbi:MAG: hypothetical protein ACLT5W_12405, partial [Ruminococcus sp.]